jgi:hypothetical protein
MAVRKLDFQNHQAAEKGCEWIDLLLNRMSGSILNDLQEALWRDIAETESELRKLRNREKRRKARWAQMAKPGQQGAELRRHHLEQLERRRVILEERRRILRNIGDACAWIVLRADASSIHALHARGRTHFLADGLGMLGPLSVMRQAHSSGKFLVVNTDLTRCLGVGDLVAVPTEGAWLRPLVFEVKTRLEGEHDFAIWLIGARPMFPDESEVLARFSQATGFGIHDPRPLNEREARQTDEIREGAARILERWLPVTSVLNASCKEHWPVVESVLTRAQQSGTAYETAEDGIVYAAIRNAPGDIDAVLMNRMRRDVATAGVRPPDYEAFSSLEVRYEDSLSSMVLPFLLWKLPRTHRVALLNSELEFFCFVRTSVWQEAFKRHELEWLQEHGWWRLSKAGRHMAFDRIRVTKFMFDVAFSAFSPDALARAIAHALDTETQ